MYRSVGGASLTRLLVVTRNSSSDVVVDVSLAPATVVLQLNQRIVWTLNSSSLFVSYPRMSDSSGNVFPLFDPRVAAAFDPARADGDNSARLFVNDQLPLRDGLAVVATPFFRSSGRFFFRDLFADAGSQLWTVDVLTAQGASPTPAPVSVPSWQDYFGASARAAMCECQFGPAPPTSCPA
jgi:hypothetical protein